MGSRRTHRLQCRMFMRDECRELGDLLEGLTSAQWEAESLCAGWSVRDVVAHLVGWDHLLLYRSLSEHMRALLRFSTVFGGSLGIMTAVNRRIDASVRGLTPDELVHRVAANDDSQLKWLFDGTHPGAHLAEYVIHQQDIRRALGMPREIPADRLAAALGGVTKLPGVQLSAWRLLRRRRLSATDVSWQRGRGPLVLGPGEAILMALAGRNVELPAAH